MHFAAVLLFCALALAEINGSMSRPELKQDRMRALAPQDPTRVQQQDTDAVSFTPDKLPKDDKCWRTCFVDEIILCGYEPTTKSFLDFKNQCSMEIYNCKRNKEFRSISRGTCQEFLGDVQVGPTQTESP